MAENWPPGRHPDPCLGWQERAFAAEAALAAAEAERNELARRFDALVKDYDADTRAAEARCERYRGALQAIKDSCGRVCEEFELCAHPACTSSYRAWALADAALALGDAGAAGENSG